MKKLFISQPMRNKTNEEILNERETAVTAARTILNEDVKIIDSFFQDEPKVKSTPLWCLGESLKLLSEADCVYFGDGWEEARGCKIEHTCAKEYGVTILNDIEM